jgi:hypothetical protein
MRYLVVHPPKGTRDRPVADISIAANLTEDSASFNAFLRDDPWLTLATMAAGYRGPRPYKVLQGEGRSWLRSPAPMVRVAVRVSVWRSVVSVLTMSVAPARMSAVMRLLPVWWGSVGHIGAPVLPGAGRLTSPRGRCRGEQGDDGECREGDATVHDALPVSAPCQFGRYEEQSTRVALNKRTTSRSPAVRLHELFVTYTEACFRTTARTTLVWSDELGMCLM